MGITRRCARAACTNAQPTGVREVAGRRESLCADDVMRLHTVNARRASMQRRPPFGGFWSELLLCKRGLETISLARPAIPNFASTWGIGARRRLRAQTRRTMRSTPRKARLWQIGVAHLMFQHHGAEPLGRVRPCITGARSDAYAPYTATRAGSLHAPVAGIMNPALTRGHVNPRSVRQPRHAAHIQRQRALARMRGCSRWATAGAAMTTRACRQPTRTERFDLQKGLRDRNSPTFTLSQNGYGACPVARAKLGAANMGSR